MQEKKRKKDWKLFYWRNNFNESSKQTIFFSFFLNVIAKLHL